MNVHINNIFHDYCLPKLEHVDVLKIFIDDVLINILQKHIAEVLLIYLYTNIFR